MTDDAKRLTPTPETLRRLFLSSGNLCAFPACRELMMNEDGVFIGQVCHIEAAEKGGQRFNRNMTNEERRSFPNLFLMCYKHHKVTDDEVAFDVPRLQQIKADHERRFSDPQRAIRDKLVDWTELGTATTVNNLGGLVAELQWGAVDDNSYADEIRDLQKYIEVFRAVPIDLRRFLGAVARRSWKMHESNVVREGMGGTSILCSDVEGALRLESGDVAARLSALESYGLMTLDEIDTALRPEPALKIRALPCGWDLWPSLMEYCDVAAISVDVFVEDLDFARLDT